MLSRDFFRQPLSGSRWRQGLTITLKDIQPFIDDLTQRSIHFRFIGSVAAWTNYTWTLAYKALIFVRPFN
jgi:hypothetical protein